MSGDVRGIIYGIAFGDAAGWPFEFDSTANEIENRLNGFTLRDFISEYTDDTQMTIACARGLMRLDGEFSPSLMYASYQDWLLTQNIPGQSRAPGMTCQRSLRSALPGTFQRRINNSKGNGGLMRVAPHGICAVTPEDAFLNAAKDAAMTHSNWSGFISAGIHAAMIWLLLNDEDRTPQEHLLSILADISVFIKDIQLSEGEHRQLSDYIGSLSTVAVSSGRDYNFADSMTTAYGWGTAEATQLTALMNLIQYGSNFYSGLHACVSTAGDSDTNGAVYGALFGAKYGYESLPLGWLELLQEREPLEEISAELERIYEARF